VLPTRSRVTIRVAVETLALAGAFLGSVEAACRIEDWVQFRTPVFATERSQVDLLVRDASGMHGRPGGHFQKWSLNAFGMRGPEVSQAKPNGILRVVTAGASETFGLYESPGREFPRQLEDSLNARFAAAPAKCEPPERAEVLNAAMPGMSLPTIEQDIRLRIHQLKPAIVVLYATPPTYLFDEVPLAARPDSLTPVAPALPWKNAFHLRVADRLRSQIKSLLPSFLEDRIRRHEIEAVLDRHLRGWRFDSVPSDRLGAFDRDLRRAVGTILSIGATPVLVTHANRFAGSGISDEADLRMWEKFYPRAAGRTIVAFDSAARLVTIAVARDSQTVLVDLAPKLSLTRGAAFADYSHFTDLGAALTAGALTQSILTGAGRNLPAACGGNSGPSMHRVSSVVAPQQVAGALHQANRNAQHQ
jgi:hypothetical protein